MNKWKWGWCVSRKRFSREDYPPLSPRSPCIILKPHTWQGHEQKGSYPTALSQGWAARAWYIGQRSMRWSRPHFWWRRRAQHLVGCNNLSWRWPWVWVGCLCLLPVLVACLTSWLLLVWLDTIHNFTFSLTSVILEQADVGFVFKLSELTAYIHVFTRRAPNHKTHLVLCESPSGEYNDNLLLTVG